MQFANQYSYIKFSDAVKIKLFRLKGHARKGIENLNPSSLVTVMVNVLKLQMVVMAGIHKTLIRIANRGDPDQTASEAVEEAVLSGSALFV